MTRNDAHKKAWSGNEIRETFLRFFESKGHRRVRSSSLVPHGDPTLLFTNAGMNQFKDVFLGLEKRDYTRATTCQKCVRAGGKHNDLENVGFTKRHHTFFEMLGNFSFGDYFKKEAIAYAWELLTSPEWFAIPKEKLYVTVFKAPNPPDINFSWAVPDDDDSKKYWSDQGVPSNRVGQFGFQDNFWQMGDTGPCGPCSEIFYDMGPEASEEGHTDCKFPCDCGRYVEIWNLVFMQYNRQPSGLSQLPKQSVDTGMGLERMAAVLQGVISNYDTDLFVPLMKRAAELCGVDFAREEKLEEGKGGAASLRVIADHARATMFLMADGVLPSNEGRGYVLRRIMRRAIQHGRLLGQTEPFFYQMMFTVCDQMKGAYPDLTESVDRVSATVKSEESRFARTLKEGLGRVEDGAWSLVLSLQHGRTPGAVVLTSSEVDRQQGREKLFKLISEMKQRGQRLVYPGDYAFKLYDTYGLPLESIQDAVRDFGLEFDQAAFDRSMQEQRARARASWKGATKEAAKPAYTQIASAFGPTEPDFYSATRSKDSTIKAIVKAGSSVSQIEAGETAEVILDRTVIYAESGGQVADTGAFYDNSGSQVLADVTGAYYPVAGLIAHKVVAKETLRVGDRVAVVADAERRAHVMRNHTGTHLVHAALRNILGTHVKQSGSLNAPDRLRFDFSHFAAVEPEELRDIEQQVNEEILQNAEIETTVTSLDEALASGALAFFGDKYPERNVRVVTIPDPRSPLGFYSKELCGGTHVRRAGEIGVLKLISEQSVAAGVRRVEAVTGLGALEYYERAAELLTKLAGQLKVGEDALLATVEKLSQTARELGRQLEAQKRKGALSQVDELAAQAQLVKGVKVIAAEVSGLSREGLRQLVDSLRQKLGSGVVALGMPENGKVALITGVTKDLTGKIHAGKLIQALAKQVGGTGGGRPDLAEAGGKDTSALKSALQTIPSLIEPLL